MTLLDLSTREMSSFFDVHASPLPILYDVPDTMVTAVAESKSEDRPSDRSPCDRPQNMHGEPLDYRIHGVNMSPDYCGMSFS